MSYVTNHKVKIFGSSFEGSAEAKRGDAVSSTNTVYGLPVRVNGVSGRVSHHLGWTGTPTGTLTLWYTGLESPNLANDDDWDQDTSWAPVNPAGTASDTFVPTGNLTGTWFRVKYVNASGSGNLWGHVTVG